MQRRVNQNWLLPNINSILAEHPQHCRDSLFNRTFAILQVDHRSIQPNALTTRCIYLVATTAFPNNGCSGYVTGFQRVHENFALYVYQLCTQRTYLFGYQCTENLFWESSTRRVILQSVLFPQRSTNTICQYQTVSSCTIVVRSREALIVHSACTASCNDNNLCLCNQNFLGFHVQQNCTCTMTLVIQNQFNCRSEVDNRNLTVQNFISQCPHDFCTGIVLCSMHSLSGSTTTMCGNHVAILVLIEFNAQLVQPLNAIRSFGYELINEFLVCCEVTAAVSIQKVLCWGIVRLVSSLNTTFCHHGVCITNSQLGYHHNSLTCFICFDCSRCTSTAAADDQNVGFSLTSSFGAFSPLFGPTLSVSN